MEGQEIWEMAASLMLGATKVKWHPRELLAEVRACCRHGENEPLKCGTLISRPQLCKPAPELSHVFIHGVSTPLTLSLKSYSCPLLTKALNIILQFASALLEEGQPLSPPASVCFLLKFMACPGLLFFVSI